MNRILLFALALFVWQGAVAQSDVPLKVVTPEQTSGFTLTQPQQGVYQVTTAPDRATIEFAPLVGKRAAGVVVLSFDYFCTTGMEFLVVTLNNDLARMEEDLIRLPIAEGWSTFSVDISQKLGIIKSPTDFLSLVIVPSNARPTTLMLKNPRLRPFTPKELSQAAQKQAREEREKRLDSQIDSYLKTSYPCRVSSVEVADNTITISGETNGVAGSLFLCEVPMYAELTENDFLSVVKLKTSNKFTVDSPRFATVGGSQYDRLYSRWVVAQRSGKGYEIVSHGRYADKIQPKYDLPYQKVTSKKGIGGFGYNAYSSDIDDLQITSITFNIWLTFMRLSPQKDNIPFVYNGKTYYADRKMIEGFDKSLRFAAEKKLIVSAIILVSPERDNPDKQVGKLMEHPDFDQAGIYSMPNMTSLESLNIYAAAIDFLASRYGQTGSPNGRIHHWIAHNEVDAGWVWTNAGVKTPLRFMDIYLKSMRLLYNTARKYDANSETFITLTHYWQSRHNQYCYPSAQLLDILMDYTDAEGDFKWGVAYHPYPESLFEPKSWLDQSATFDYNTPLITFKNLEVLDAWIKHPRAQYQGTQKRTLFLSEQNPNSKDYSPEALAEQAAGMAFAWKKMDACSGIDAYQMHGWFDQRAEGGLRIGVRRFGDDETDPAGRKPAWFVFQKVGTPQEDQACEFAKQIIGIKEWDEVRYKGVIEIP